MRLSELLDSVEYQCDPALLERQADLVTCDSRRVGEGSVFVCVQGGKSDGHRYAPMAVQQGAVSVVTDRDLGFANQIFVEEPREAYARMCANLRGNPAKKLRLLAVTGTNAKTTITYLLKSILENAGKTVGLLGTIQNVIGDMAFPAKHTTPDPAELHTLLSRMVEAGCEYVVMEASSHALDQYRLAGCEFESAVFTNLTQDHLDYHGTMENYYLAKKKLFGQCKTAVINLDDEYGVRLAGEVACPVVTFATEGVTAGIRAKHISLGADACRFTLCEGEWEAQCSFAMPGRFSVSNALAAVGCVRSAGLTFQQAAEGINRCAGVMGRTEIIEAGMDFTIIRDYAHAPDSLEKIISTMKEFAPARVVTLFGCAGDRDRTKRAKMGEIASRLSDLVIFTSDNPRGESIQQIIDDTLPGLLAHDTPYEVIPDRYRAIRWALEHCQRGDILLLEGKGHEDYQVLDYGTIYFDEKEIVAHLVKRGIRRENDGKAGDSVGTTETK